MDTKNDTTQWKTEIDGLITYSDTYASAAGAIALLFDANNLPLDMPITITKVLRIKEKQHDQRH